MVVCSVRVIFLLQTTMLYIYQLLEAFREEFPPAELTEPNLVELQMSKVLEYFTPYLGDSYGAEAYTKLLSDAGYQMKFSEEYDEVVWVAKSNITPPR